MPETEKGTDGGRGGGGVLKTQPKKRVLNQKSDNPLLRRFDGVSSGLLGEGSRRKGRGLVGKVGKKPTTKSVDEDAAGRQDDESKNDKTSAQQSGSGLVESVESESENLVPARGLKKDLKTTRAKLDMKARESKASHRSLSKLMKSVEADYPEPSGTRVLENDAGAANGKKSKKLVYEEATEDKEAATTPSTPVESTVSEDEDVKQALKSTKTRQVRKVAKKPRGSPPPRAESEEEDFGIDSDGLSDFIVDDSTFLEEEDTVIEEPAPKSVRKLVKGRRPNRIEDSDDEELEVRMGKLKVEEDASNILNKVLRELNLDDSDDEDMVETRTRKRIQSEVPRRPKNDNVPPASSDIEDPFTLRYSPSMNKPIKVPKETRFATPPGSPVLKPRGLVSPKKKIPRIPSTPHRPSMDSFWQQDVVNDWNDEYSPRKINLPQPHFNPDSIPIDPRIFSPRKSPVKDDRLTKEAKKCFALRKHSLAEKFFLELDSKITNGEITRLSQATGGVRIIWSKKLHSTAGRANWKRETVKSSMNPHLAHYRHYANIELAEKVIDDDNRLLNTIAHEFCHLTTFMIDNVKTNPHGKEFKAWGEKVTDTFGNLGIEVTTKHSYAIDYKYIWECENCGIEFKRHSKSIDTERQRCGNCKSKLFQKKPVPKLSKGNGGKEKALTEYQLFVKENMSNIKQANPGSPQKEIMSLVGKSFREYKASKLNGSVVTVDVVDISEGMESRQLTPEEEKATFVARKLDFLDLTKE
ncbi:hypothetical protein N431DRAFT_427763 [Stipitochalara longipes BDJ]|nr:hypothetical protein N431DRAFT_427763 [Stipitochalara longipes BDJ]